MKKERIRLSFWSALMITMTFCVFGPIEMIMSNASEFWFSIIDILPYILLFAFTCFAGIFIISYFVSLKTKIVFPILLGLGLALYIQGNFMLVSYGVMDGTPIDWNSFGAWPLVNSLIWILILVLPIILYIKKKSGLQRLLCCCQ